MKFKKLHVEETVIFAMKHVPQADHATLEKLIELVNLGGNYGEIEYDELLAKMELVLKYVPTACVNSLFIIMDLLDLCPSQLAKVQPNIRPIMRLNRLSSLKVVDTHQG